MSKAKSEYEVEELYIDRLDDMAMTAKTSVDSVRLEMISDMEIPTPSIDEQLKIGQLFTNIDSLITLHQRECDAYKTLKKAMLQQMFV